MQQDIEALKRRVVALENGLTVACEMLSEHGLADGLWSLTTLLPDLPPDEYSVEDREQAAQLCDVMASLRAGGERHTEYVDAASWLETSAVAADLAGSAIIEVPGYFTCGDVIPSEEQWAEAASWIRSGWSPGDIWDEPVVEPEPTSDDIQDEIAALTEPSDEELEALDVDDPDADGLLLDAMLGADDDAMLDSLFDDLDEDEDALDHVDADVDVESLVDEGP